MVAFVVAGDPACDSAELLAGAAVLAAAFEGDVGSTVEGGVASALVSADAFILESFFERGHVVLLGGGEDLAAL